MKRYRSLFAVIMLLLFMVVNTAGAEEQYFPNKSGTGTIGTTDRYWRMGYFNQFTIPEISAPSGHPSSNTGWLYVKDSGGSSSLFFEDDAGTVTNLETASATAWDDIGDADGAGTVAFSTYQQVITSAKTDGDNLIIKNIGNLADNSVVLITHDTGNPTDGTLLEVVSTDTDLDPLVITANSANRVQVFGSGNVTIAGLTGTVTYTDWAFDADGKLTLTPDDGGTSITVTPSAALTTGLDVSSAQITNGVNLGATKLLGTTAVIDFTNFDVSAAGAVTATSVSAGTIKQDALVPASAAPTTITLDGAGAGGVTIGGTSTGAITLGGGATSVNLPATVDMTLSGGTLGITDTGNGPALSVTNNSITNTNLVTLSATALTSGKGVSMTVGNALTGAGYYLGYTDGAGITGKLLEIYNGAADVFKVERYGATTILGNSGSDMLTVTAGDVQITAGSIDLDNGIIAVDTAQDLASNITRNFNGAGTAPVLTVKDDHASSTNTALAVIQDGTAASTGVSIAHSGDNPALAITAGAARTGDVINVTMANQLDQRAINITGAATGSAGAGLIEVHSTGAMAGALLRLDYDTAQMQAIDGSLLTIDDDSLAAAGTQYAVDINSNANGALNVSKGASSFAGTVTITNAGSLTVNEDVAVSLDANDEEVNVTASAVDYAAGSGIVTIYGSGNAGQTNESYLLRLVRKADGDAQDAFLLLQDNSTGAAANGDQKLKIGTNGTITMGAGATATGGTLIYSFENLTIANAGTAASINQVVSFIATDGNGDEDNATLADGTVGQLKIFVSKTEGAGADTWKITPTNLNGGSKISFDGVVGDSCTLIFDGTKWNVVSTNGGTIS